MHKRRSSQRDKKCRNRRCSTPGGGIPYRRGLCSICYRNKAIRLQFTPLIATRCGDGAARQDFYGEAKEPEFLCDQEAGTVGKVELLGLRADGLEALFPEVEKVPLARSYWERKAMALPFRKRLRYLIARRGYSEERKPYQCNAKPLETMAKRAELKASEIRAYLAGKMEPSYRAAKAMARVLRVSIELLMDPPIESPLRPQQAPGNRGDGNQLHSN